ncbi:hypothetical protein MRB53_002326 [Persea americana]|uniref:Uncharacterized protein n=1 Tax=Persea americana TaxID=3435 RepID=A0ACC2MV28_PERAE|nr:hypothetical protein MRB53_002326 [Persea americana]
MAINCRLKPSFYWSPSSISGMSVSISDISDSISHTATPISGTPAPKTLVFFLPASQAGKQNLRCASLITVRKDNIWADGSLSTHCSRRVLKPGQRARLGNKTSAVHL